YSLLILVVEETGSSVNTAILLCAFTLPGIILAVPAGAAADILPKQLTLTAGYLLRAVIAAALAYYHDDLAFIYLLAAASAAVGQVFSPAESSTVPALVRRDQLTTANSWMLLVLVLGQVIGLAVLAPLLLKILDPQAVFVACAGLFLSAAVVIGWIASGFSGSAGPRLSPSTLLDLAREGFRILGANRNAYLATVYLTTAIAVSRALVVLLPNYTEDVLNIKAENTD